MPYSKTCHQLNVLLFILRSPVRKNGFKFSNPSVPMNNINIFSQTVMQDDDDDYDVSY